MMRRGFTPRRFHLGRGNAPSSEIVDETCSGMGGA